MLNPSVIPVIGGLVVLLIVVAFFALLPVFVGILDRLSPEAWRDFDYVNDYAEPVRRWAAGRKCRGVKQ